MSKLPLSPGSLTLPELRSKLGVITDYLLREISEYVAFVCSSGRNTTVLGGYDASGNNIQYNNQYARVLSELARLKATLIQHFTQQYSDISTNDKRRQEATNIGDLGNIYIDDRVVAIQLVREACTELLISCKEKQLPVEAYIEVIREFKTEIHQFSALWSLKRHLRKYKGEK